MSDSHWEGKPFCGCRDGQFLRMAASGDAKWPTSRITWHLGNTSLLTGITAERARADVTEAWRRWEAVCGIEPQEVARAEDAMVVLSWGPIDGPGQVLAWSELADGTTRQKKQRYDNAEAWGRSINLVAVACHEIGHVLGLPHLAPGNLLQPTYSASISTPQAGDIAEVVRRYGPPKQPPAPAPAPVPPGGGRPGVAVMVPVLDDVLAGVLRRAGWDCKPPLPAVHQVHGENIAAGTDGHVLRRSGTALRFADPADLVGASSE